MQHLAQLAQDVTFTAPEGFGSLDSLTFGNVIQGLISLVLVVAAVIFFFMLVIGGIKWIMSGGDKGQTESARNQITAALVGLVIVFSAWAILQLINSFFAVPGATAVQPEWVVSSLYLVLKYHIVPTK